MLRSSCRSFLTLLVLAFLFLPCPGFTSEGDFLERVNSIFFPPGSNNLTLFKLEGNNGHSIEMVKNREGKWLSGSNIRTDAAMLSHYWEVLSEGQAEPLTDRIDTVSSDKYNITLVVGYRDGIYRLFIGDEIPSLHAFIAWVSFSGKRFLLNREFVDKIEKELLDFETDRVFPVRKDSISHIVIERENDLLELVKKNGLWQMKHPVEVKTRSSAVDAFLEVITRERFDSIEDWIDSYKKLPHRVWIMIEGPQGMPVIDFDAYIYGDSLILHPASGDSVFYLSDSLWMVLNRPASEFMDRRIFTSEREEVEKIAIEAGDSKLLVVRENNIWRAKDTAVEAERLQKLVSSVLSLKAVRIIKEDRFRGNIILKIKVSTGSGELHELEISDFDVSYLVKHQPLVSIDPYTNNRQRQYFYIARIGGRPYLIVVSSFDVGHLLEFLSRK